MKWWEGIIKDVGRDTSSASWKRRNPRKVLSRSVVFDCESVKCVVVVAAKQSAITTSLACKAPRLTPTQLNPMQSLSDP